MDAASLSQPEIAGNQAKRGTYLPVYNWSEAQ